MSRLEDARARLERKRADLQRKKQWNHESRIQSTPQRVIYQQSRSYPGGVIKLFAIAIFLILAAAYIGGH